MHALLLAVALVAAAPEPQQDLVPFVSTESMARLDRSRHKVDFFTLANHFESEQNVAMCGPATAVIVLNALRARNNAVARPRDPSLFPAEFAANVSEGLNPTFDRYTQGAFFDERFTSVKPRAVFYGSPGKDGRRDPGMQLRQLHEVLLKHELDSKLRVVADDADEGALKAEIVANLATPNDYVIVNYKRAALGQKGGGHISPLAAYDEQSDSFLVLDVNPNQGKTWVWVPARALFAAMRTKDTVENRGFLLVREGAGSGEGSARARSDRDAR
jgi:hypothetical protein